ncbi:MAG: LPS assembly lipoprotein LptE [Candidatus Sumerlaeota bacterium]|nr:LPS assembly lipoprotein LptE [Candidatus Sumerlaeota bacterium]
MNSRFCAIALGLAAASFLSSCASRIPMTRNLPEWVHKVYVPIFENKSTEPGLEEIGTRMAIEEFLADGRLEVVSQPKDADLVVKVKLQDYNSTVNNFERDRFSYNSIIAVRASVALYEPGNLKTPFSSLGSLQASHPYVSDFRNLNMSLDVDARDALMRSLAGSIVRMTLSGYREPQPGKKAPAGSENKPEEELDTRYPIALSPFDTQPGYNQALQPR